MPLGDYLTDHGDRRYTDRDVREHPELVSVARNFLFGYGGDFEFLRNARDALQGGGALSVGVIRGVLNCMRTDPLVSGYLPVPPSGAPLTLLHPWQPIDPRPVSVIPARPPRVRIQATFKKQFLISTHPTAQTFHLLDTEHCQLWWLPYVEEYQARLFVLCKRSIYPPNILMTNEIPEGRRICVGCYRHTVGG